MTSEILIMNEKCVAIAADSAVTVGSGARKVFEADKLFSLSGSQPIGVMFYGGASIGDVPVSVLVSEYRSRPGADFRTLDDCVRDFMGFVERGGGESFESNPLITADRVEREAAMQAIDLLDSISREMRSGGRESTRGAPRANEIMRERLGAISADEGEASFMLSRLEASAEVREAIDRSPLCRGEPLDRGLLLSLLSKVLASGGSKRRSTGVVIAGYGSDEPFPSFREIAVDGVFYRGPVYREVSSKKIGVGTRSWIEPFAQDDVVRTYMYGFDEEMMVKMLADMEHLWNTAMDELVDRIGGNEDVKNETREKNRHRVAEYGRHFWRCCTERSYRPIQDAVRYLSKGEMAEMAESLIGITSLKRRVSNDIESVGGPIDVAVISKSEGLIWVKRKHYFNLDLNPRYVDRRRPERDV
ncbi:MAG: hypothetical protein LBG62_03870 [Candidatus Methanoplasma sp.]|jgi:hypothetical protein|nr:hypothetical protein [Candidatus Methanoplasma sp.]